MCSPMRDARRPWWSDSKRVDAVPDFRTVALGDDLATGGIGFVWPFVAGAKPSLDSEPESGFIQTTEMWASLECLESDAQAAWLRDDKEEPPVQAFAIITSKLHGLLLEIQRRSWTRNIGGYRASVKRYSGRTFVADVPFERLRSLRLVSLRASFIGMSGWAGASAKREMLETDKRGRGKSWSVHLESPPGQSALLLRGRTIAVEFDWRAEGPLDRRIISTPVGIKCEARGPTAEPIDLVGPLLRVQDLMSYAYSGFVEAESGRASLDLDPDKHGRDETSVMWNGALMVRTPAAEGPADLTGIPLFHLTTIGGARGLSRWIQLCEVHQRAVRPIVSPFRLGFPSAEVMLLEVAAAIEYWVNIHRRTRKWAGKERGPHATALALRVGAAFADFVGDPVRWGERFREVNNKVKHDPSFRSDFNELVDLAISSRKLLASALLDRVAGDHAPSVSVLGHHSHYQLRDRLRSRYS